MSAAPPSPRPMPPSLPTPPKLSSTRPRSSSPPPPPQSHQSSQPQPIAVSMPIPSGKQQQQQQPKSNGTTSSISTTADDASPSQLAAMLSSSYEELAQVKSELSTAQSQLASFSKRAETAERKLALLESAISIPVTFPHALAGLSPAAIQAEQPDVLSNSDQVDSRLKQAALAVKECELRAEKSQSLADARSRELSRLRAEFDRVQGELTAHLSNAAKSPREREELNRVKDDLARTRDELSRTREVLERTREDLVMSRDEVQRLASSKHDREREKQINQAWDEADSFLRLCEGRMAEARALFSRIISQNTANAGWLPPVPVSGQQQQPGYHHHPPPPPPPSGQTSAGGNRISSPLMPRTSAILPSSTHAPPPPPPPTIAYPRLPNQHPPRHRRDRSPGHGDSYPYEEDGERPSKRQRAISGADQRKYPPEEAYRSPPSHPPPANTVRQYNTYPDVSAHQAPSSQSQGGQPQLPPPPHARHRSRSSSGSQSLDEFLLAAADTKSSNNQAQYHEYHRPRERGDSGTSSNSGYQASQQPPPPQPLQAQQTQTHVFAPVQTGAPVKKGKSSASMGDVQNPALATPTQFYPPTNEQGQRLCRQCGMTGRYKDNKCVEKWGPGPLGPGTVCDRCRKKMKRVERRGTLENSSHANIALPTAAPAAYNPQPVPSGHHPPPPQPNLARTDTVVYPNPAPHREQALRVERPAASSRPHSRPQSPPPTSMAPAPVPASAPAPPAPAPAPAPLAAAPAPAPRRGPSPPPTIEVLPTSSATGSAAAGGEPDTMEVDDLDADADADDDGDEADIDGELLEAVDAAEKGSHHASD